MSKYVKQDETRASKYLFSEGVTCSVDYGHGIHTGSAGTLLYAIPYGL